MAGFQHSVKVSPRLFGIPCWAIPFFAGCSWLVTLMSMLITWCFKGSPHFREMQRKQSLPYISDVGASEWGKPLFITGSALTNCSFVVAFAAERWLRHKGLLVHASSFWGNTMSGLATFFTGMGVVGLTTLTIADAKNHINIHDPCIGVFIGGYLLAAAFMCAEKHRTSKKFPANALVRRSFLIKLTFILIELGLTAIFGLTAFTGFTNLSVVFEWIIALFFIFYMWSFAVDFLPIPGALGMGITSRGTEIEIGPDDDQVELVRDPEKLWDLEMASVKRPGTAWSVKSGITVSTRNMSVVDSKIDDEPPRLVLKL